MRIILIENLLDKIGIHINQLGYKYLTYAIELKLENSDIRVLEMYKKIADKYNTTSVRVERAIRHARQSAENRIERIFDVEYKIYSGDLIALLAREVKRKEEKSFSGDIDEMHTFKNQN